MMRSRMLVMVTICLASLLLLVPEKANGQIYWEKLFDSLSYESNIRPVPRRDAAIGYDVSRNRIVVFGGWQTNTDNFHYRIPVLLDDTWEFDLYTRKSILYLGRIKCKFLLSLLGLIR